MNQWDISLSKSSLKFLRKNHISETIVTEAIADGIKKMSGEEINIDLKKLHPPYKNYFRIRIGRIRISFNINFDLRFVDVAEVDWRGSAYRL